MLNQVKIVLLSCFMVCSLTAQAVNPTSIKKETPAYIIDVKYPQGFHNERINTVVKEFIEKTQKDFFKELAEDRDIPADAPGKSGLNITYSIPYKIKKALSVRFNISIYHQGAAHPSNSVAVLNFIKGHQVQLADLFTASSDYLKTIADFCRNNITAKKISDAKWIQDGTQPIAKNYQIWTFTPQGIAILFDTYQVAAYVYGAQTVSIPLSQVSSMLKPKMSHLVWGH